MASSPDKVTTNTTQRVVFFRGDLIGKDEEYDDSCKNATRNFPIALRLRSIGDVRTGRFQFPVIIQARRNTFKFFLYKNLKYFLDCVIIKIINLIKKIDYEKI